MKSKDFKIYREGQLEGCEIGLRDMVNYERIFKLEEYKNRAILLLVLITGLGNILYFIFYHHHNVYVRLSFHIFSLLLFFMYFYFLVKDYSLEKNNLSELIK